MEILVGKSKTGKSRYIYNLMKENLQEGIIPILFVPSQKREITEINYMNTLKVDGIIGTKITTISNYISIICKEQNIHFDDNYITKLDKKVILNKIIMENQDKFNVFKKVSNKQGFLDLLNIYMDIFRKEGLDKEKIYNTSLTNKILEEKLKEVYGIYQIYEQSIENKYVDNVDEIDLILKNQSEILRYFENSVVYIDGYNNFTNIEYKFIEFLVKNNIKIVLSLTTDITCVQDIYEENSNDIFEEPNKTYLRLLKIISKYNSSQNTEVFLNNFLNTTEQIKYLGQNIFENLYGMYEPKSNEKSVFVSSFQNAYDETQKIANIISKELKNGKRYKDFAIYTTNLDDYAFLISRIFSDYNIPFYVDTKKSIISSKLVTYILTLLNVVNGYKVSDILDILKLGLVNILPEDISYLENYILEFDITRYGLKKEFYLNNEKYDDIVYDLERLNHIREKINGIYEKFGEEILKCKNCSEYVNVIYSHLVENDIFKNYDIFLDSIEDAKYQIYTVNVERQVWEKICEIFLSILKIYGAQEIGIVEFRNILENTLKDLYVKTIPPTKDSVIVADINVSKLNPVDIAFFVGASEDNFPKLVEQDILFNDYEIENLRSYEIEFKQDTISKENMAKYNIYEAINNITEKLYISLSSTNLLGESTRVSSFVQDVCNMLGITIKSSSVQDEILYQNLDAIYSKEQGFLYMCKLADVIFKNIEKINDYDNCANNEKSTSQDIITSKNKYEKIIGQFNSLYSYYLNDKKYHDILKYNKSQGVLKKETVEKVYKSDFKSSVYKLEMFKKCPFSYYLNYVLNINKRKVFEITSMDTGTFMHNVIEEFSDYLFKNGYMWQDIIKEDETLEEKFEKELEKIILYELDRIFKKQKNSIKYDMYKKKLTNTLKKVVLVIARSFRQSDFVPFGYEIEFSEKGKFLPIKIKLDNDKTMNIVGKIDRVDVLREDEKMYVRVVDYKSSMKNLTIDDIKDGISLQLMTYLDAFLQNQRLLQKNKVIPAGCVYFNLSNNLVNLKDYTKDEISIKKEVIKSLRLRGIFLSDVNILEKMDKKIESSDEKLIDISKTRLDSSKKALSEDEFNNLCSEVTEILKKIGNDMIKGIVTVSKNKKGEHCKYCDYQSICRKNSLV